MRITQVALLSIVGCLRLSQTLAQYPPKPWPTYSQENMPRTDFTCHGKILGGYYADPETQCQMFHVCVKVAGVGVKDFRFLCPNSTAFDQEAQICADWGDVDCEQATLYYSSDNFDLYRLGSGFESKRAPVAEDEQPFHLQNAESNDIRRTPHQNPSFHRNNVAKYNDDSFSNKQNFGNARNTARVKPTTTTTTTTTTTEASYQVDRRGDDEIFKGSHSSNFFNNRNKEDDLVDFPQKAQPFQRNHNHRGRRPHNNFRNNQNNNIQPFPTKASEFPTEGTTPSTTPTTTSTTTTYAPPTTRARPVQNPVPFPQDNTKTVSLQSSFRTEESSNNDNNGREFFSSSTDGVPFQRNNYQQTNEYYKSTTQQRIQPTTYSPPLSSFSGDNSSPKYEEFRRFDKVSTTPALKFKQPAHNSFYNAQFENKATESYDQIREQTFHNAPTAFVANNRSAEVVNDVARTVPKTNNRGHVQQQNSFNARGNGFNERPTFVERQNSVPDRSNSFVERQNTFNERPNDTGHSLGEKSADNFDRQEPKPQRSRRPSRFRGTKIFNRAELDEEVKNPLNVRPLEIQTQPASSTQNPATDKYEQNNYNGYTNNYRQSPPPSSTPVPNRYELNNYNGFNDNFRPSPRLSQSTTPNTYSSPSAFGFPDVNRASPSPFSLPVDQQAKQGPSANFTQQQTPFQSLPTFDESPRGFSFNPPYHNQSPVPARASSTTPRSYNNPEKYDERSIDNYTPATQAKKFSTLVPKDQFYPTTFRPATYKKVILGYDQKLGTSTKYAAASYLPTTTTTTTTFRPQPNNQDIDEDDGQYHPELYEKDFARTKFKARKPQVSRPNFDRDFDRQSSEPHSDTEDEEFLNTAHSLNIAAGANQLRAEKFKEFSPKVFRGSPTSYTSAPVASTTIKASTTTRKPIAPSPKSKPSSKSTKKPHKSANEDASYDYAYYDSFSGNPQDYEYDLISEFGKTRRN